MEPDPLMRNTIDIWPNPRCEKIGHSVKEFLCNLNGPTWIDIPGQDNNRTRVLTTLLHGNEPSGTKALFNWLANPGRKPPLTNLSCLICSVEAALLEPEFSHRYLPDTPDMNRCFRPPYDSTNGKLAEEILHRIRDLTPEAVIDMHNTSGAGPDFAVTTSLNTNYVNLAKNFSHRLILTELHLGALMEADLGCPIITLECGGSSDFQADQKALSALEWLTTGENLFRKNGAPQPDIYKHPLRFEIRDNVSICYADHPVADSNITLYPDIEKYNFGITPENICLGWVGPKGLGYFSAIDDCGHDIKGDLFCVKQDKLYTSQPLRLFMVTPRPEIAKKDCLFYLVRANTP